MREGWKLPVPEGWAEIVWDAFAEDVGTGDPASALFPEELTVGWYIEAQATGVVCGVGAAIELLAPEPFDPEDCLIEHLVEDGDRVESGTIVLQGRALASSLMTRERTALNFLMMLSGTASLTARFVDKLDGLDCKVVDTRKTVPGLRTLQKYAVRCGGGINHRMGLYDGLMVKDNHIRAAGSVRAAVAAAKQVTGHMMLVEVECETEEMVVEAVEAGADIVMLDNMDPFTMQNVCKRFRDRVKLEASGGVTLDTVRGVAATGVHAVSVGALTHSAPALPFHLEVE